MIYLVTTNQLYESDKYEIISLEKSLELLNACEELEVDSETFGLDPHIVDLLCFQFGNKLADFQIVVDCQTIDIKNYKEILETKQLIGHNLCFDCKFLYKHGIIPTKVWDTMTVEQLLHLGYDNKYFHYGLKDVLERRLNVSMDKSIRTQINLRGLDESVILYAAGDVTYLTTIKEQQYKECVQKDCLKGALLENDFVRVHAYLEWCGIKLDENKWKEKMKNDQEQLEKYKKDLDDWLLSICYSKDIEGNTLSFVHTTKLIYSSEVDPSDTNLQRHKLLKNGYVCINKSKETISYTNEPTITVTTEIYQKTYPNSLKYIKEKYTFIETQGDLFSGFDPNPKCLVNWSSSKQVVDIAKAIGFNTSVPDKKTGNSKDSVLEKHLKTQKNIDDIFLDLYFSYQEFSKVVSTYGQNQLNAINPLTGRIHTTYRALGCSSGRMSCGSNTGNPDLAKLKQIHPSDCKYPNIQNLPSDEITRAAFTCEKENYLVSADFSALESRLGADIYNEQSMIDEFLHGSGDMHSLCAYMVYKDQIPRDTNIKDIKKLYPKLRKEVKAIEFSQQFVIFY
jgi:DNA polymerase I-like protein with 3'-5' exonuclease and polymerase domains